MTDPAVPIIFDKVSFSYDEEADRPALDTVKLSVARGEFVALVGANGSGKSTLSKMVNALIIPDEGRVLTLGMDTASDDDELIFEIRSHAGLVLQNPDSQIVASSVSDDVAFGPENLAVPREQMVVQVDEALDNVKMAEYALANPHNLSGGQKQRVCIAGLLAMRPDVLVLDEPGAMLDIRGRRGIRRVLGELHAAGLTVVLVTHFMEEAALAERVIVLDKGTVVLQGTPREVFAHGALLRDMGLDVPFSVQLGFALRRHGFEVPDIASPRELKEVLLPLLSVNAASSDASVEADTHTKEPSPQEASYRKALEAFARKELSPAPLVRLEKVSYFYPTSNTGEDQTPALDKVSLSLDAGELLGVVGHTGSGKTTLLRILAGLLFASSGTVQVAGARLEKGHKLAAFHTKVGMVFQYPERQLFAPTVAEDIAFGPVNAGLKKEEVDTLVRSALEQVNLSFERYAHRSPFELSGGEKRRVAIAGVLVSDPEVLIFDEPTAGLDVKGQQNIKALIARLREQGKTIILTSHSLDAIAQLSTTVAVLNKGVLTMLGSPKEIFTRANEPELKRINLGLPQAAEFARELNELGIALPESLFTVDELALALSHSLSHSASLPLGGELHGA